MGIRVFRAAFFSIYYAELDDFADTLLDRLLILQESQLDLTKYA